MKIVDISRPLENTLFADPPGLAPKINYLGHNETTDMLLSFFPGLKREQLRGPSLGDGSYDTINAFRDVSRRALPLPLDDGRR
jgi:hypothetical protein